MDVDYLESLRTPHLSSCPSCRRRWQQALQLDQLHQKLDGHASVVLADSALRLPFSGVVYTSVLSPLGMVWIAAGSRGLVRVDFFCDEAAFCHAVERDGRGIAEYAPDALAEAVRQLTEYFEGRRTAFDLPIDLSGVTGFQRAVLEAVFMVPYGEVASYRDVAYNVGKPGAMRAVGAAVATNPMGLVIPCHRIVRSDGTAGEYAVRTVGSCGVHYKLMLLALEGVHFAESATLSRTMSSTKEAAG